MHVHFNILYRTAWDLVKDADGVCYYRNTSAGSQPMGDKQPITQGAMLMMLLSYVTIKILVQALSQWGPSSQSHREPCS